MKRIAGFSIRRLGANEFGVGLGEASLQGNGFT
jgi:hypothetical protein